MKMTSIFEKLAAVVHDPSKTLLKQWKIGIVWLLVVACVVLETKAFLWSVRMNSVAQYNIPMCVAVDSNDNIAVGGYMAGQNRIYNSQDQIVTP